MKILLLNQTFYPDAVATAQQLTDLAVYLTEQGHEVSVLADYRGYENREKTFPLSEVYKGITIHRLRSTGFGKQRFILRLLDAFSFDLMLARKLLFFSRQDVVISFTSPPLIGFLGTLFCLLKGGRSVQWLMDINPDAAFSVGYIKKKSLLGKFLNFIFEFTLKMSSHIVVLDRWMKKVAIEHGGKEENVSIVHPWALFEPPKENGQTHQSVFRKQNGFEGKTIVLYSGNHSVVHPLYTLMDAAKRMKNDPEVVFVFVGGGLRTLEVKAFKERENLDNIVQLPTIPRELLSDALMSVDAHVVVMGEAVNGLVHSSKVYGSLATGRPIIYIGPEKGHVMDLLKNCHQAYHAEHGEVEKVVDAVRKIKSLSRESKEVTAIENKRFYLLQVSKTKSLSVVSEEVLKLPKEPQGFQPQEFGETIA